ncbi:hypothetical protein [Micavibrio aeruginosavorus]|uniref:hypothetical protein n=1 Tax=Micavibrio aeruginosavorus TaxID=349221 RepID=UPI0005A0AF26|nr:hypothetical protein [Micavibrio aeruginosavorus]
MSELITLDEYFNLIGKELVPSYSNEAVYYYSERKKELAHLRDQARQVYKVALNKIWDYGRVKVSMRLEQGYIDPPFSIEEFDFAHSGCVSSGGDYYRCKLEIENDTRGRPRLYDLDDIIAEYVTRNYRQAKLPLKDIKAIAVISHVAEFHRKKGVKIPSDGTIRACLHRLYPECKKTSRNSKK